MTSIHQLAGASNKKSFSREIAAFQSAFPSRLPLANEGTIGQLLPTTSHGSFSNVH